jgi:5-methylcytosine-specific restriction protein A
MPSRKPITYGSVVKAVEECNARGRDKFLKHYHWGKAREYFLVFKGIDYDSKAILAVAHKFEYADEGPLRYKDNIFGGKDDAAKVLRELGFDIEYRPLAKRAR